MSTIALHEDILYLIFAEFDLARVIETTLDYSDFCVSMESLQGDSEDGSDIDMSQAISDDGDPDYEDYDDDDFDPSRRARWIDRDRLADAFRVKRKMLESLCLVSKQFCSIAQPILQRVAWHDGYRMQAWELIRTFWQRSELAAKIRVASIDAFGKIAEIQDLSHANLLEAHPELLTVAKNIAGGVDNELVKGLKVGDFDAELNLLLALLPNLETLQIRLSFEWPIGSLTEFLQRYKSDSKVLSRLRSIIVLARAGYDRDTLEATAEIPNLAALFDLPNIRKLKVVRLEPDSGRFIGTSLTFPMSTSYIEVLDLDQCVVPASYLQQLLGAIKSLRSFRFAWHETEDGSLSDMGLTDLMKSLSIHKHTLHKIDLDSTNCSQLLFDTNIIHPIGSFEDFASLRVLKISSSLLLGADIDTDRTRRDHNDPDYNEEDRFRDQFYDSDFDERLRNTYLEATSGQPPPWTRAPGEVLVTPGFDIFPRSLVHLKLYENDEFNLPRAMKWIEGLLPELPTRMPRLECLDLQDFDLFDSPDDEIQVCYERLEDAARHFNSRRQPRVLFPSYCGW